MFVLRSVMAVGEAIPFCSVLLDQYMTRFQPQVGMNWSPFVTIDRT